MLNVSCELEQNKRPEQWKIRYTKIHLLNIYQVTLSSFDVTEVESNFKLGFS